MSSLSSTKIVASARPAVAKRAMKIRCEAVPPLTRVKQAGVALAGAAVLLVGTPAFAEADLAEGAQVFLGNCAACHAGGNNTVEEAKTLRKDALEKYLSGGLNVGAIETQVRKGKGEMPAWEDRLDDDEIESVAAYVYKQATDDLWPPA